MGRGGRESGGGRPRDPLSRDVQVSKKISWLLRHGAEKEGLQLDDAGFLSVADLLANHTFRSMKVSFDEVRQIVQSNDKQRFTMVPLEQSEAGAQQASPSSDPKDYRIRANQGHSLKVKAEGLLEPITSDNVPSTAVHGTTHAAWIQIVESGGLKPMQRNHIHLASGLPAGFTSVVDQDQRSVEAPVISGMRKTSTVLVYLDVQQAMDHGLAFWLSDNGVILTEGNEEGLLPMRFFKRVEDRTGEGVLVQNGQIIKSAPARWASKTKAKP